MTEPNWERPATTDEFEAALSGLIAAARENGLDVEGGWECRDGTGHAWDVVVMRLAADGGS